MANITVALTGEFLRHLFQILQQHPDGLPAGDAIQQVQQKVKLTDYERGSYKSGGQRFDKILRWATVDCKKAGWLIKEEGRWYATEAGIAALERKSTRLYSRHV